MYYSKFPPEIQKLIDIYTPYENEIKDGELHDAPIEAIDAFNKVKKWFWEQGQ